MHLWLVDSAGKGSSTQAASATVRIPSSTGSGPTPSRPCCRSGQRRTREHACNGACPAFEVKGSSYEHGRLRLTITGLPGGDRLKITISHHVHQHHKRRVVKRIVVTKVVHYQPHNVHRRQYSLQTSHPFKVYLQAFRGNRRVGGHRLIENF